MATDGVTADGMPTTPHVDGRSPSNQNPTTIPQPATPSASSPITNLGNENAPSITSPNQNRDSQGTTAAVDVAPTPVFAVRNAELECQWEVTKCTELRGTIQRSRNTINVYEYFKKCSIDYTKVILYRIVSYHYYYVIYVSLLIDSISLLTFA